MKIYGKCPVKNYSPQILDVRRELSDLRLRSSAVVQKVAEHVFALAQWVRFSEKISFERNRHARLNRGIAGTPGAAFVAGVRLLRRVGVLPLTYGNQKSKLLPTQLLADSLKTPSRPLDQPTFLPDVRQRTYLLDRQFKMNCIHGCPVGRDMEISTMKTLKFARLAAGLLAAAPAFAQTAGGT
ncbi:MAG TPA: hypothetical protein VIK79_09700, partial [Xanthobacteraceae bacterium]